jgi:hypothetical protein
METGTIEIPVSHISSFTEGVLKTELDQIFFGLNSLDNEKIQVFVHGSWADNSRTAFSDLDDFIIVEDDYFETAQAVLKEIEMKFQQIDPIQHHGHWLIKKSKLLDYDNSFMPLFILNESICLKGKNYFPGHINRQLTLDGTIGRIINTCRNIESFFRLHADNKLNIYNLKKFVGSIALLPAMIYQLRGIEKGKRNAIENAEKIFSEKSLLLLQWATDLRNNWSQLTGQTSYQKLFEYVMKCHDPVQWRKKMDIDSPILKCECLSEVRLNKVLIEEVISDSIRHIDRIKLKEKDIDDYEKAYFLIERNAIENNAILVGRFGNIQYPGISDLDVFICFEDADYKHACENSLKFLENEKSVEYFFTHSPFYISMTMLNEIKYLHTLYNLRITYNPKNITCDFSTDKEYSSFLNTIWSFTFLKHTAYFEQNYRYFDVRKLLIVLKNLHKSVDNLENIYGLKISNALEQSDVARKLIMTNGITERFSIEKIFLKAIHRIKEIDNILQGKVKPLKNKMAFSKDFIYHAHSNKNKKYNNNRISYLNPVYFNVLYEIVKAKNDNGKLYYQTLSKYFQNHKKTGGYFNSHVSVIPDIFFTQTSFQRNYNLKKYQLRNLIKNCVYKLFPNEEGRRNFISRSKRLFRNLYLRT